MFKLEITSIEEFIILIKIIKGELPDDELVKSLTNQINKSTDKLKQAEDENG